MSDTPDFREPVILSQNDYKANKAHACCNPSCRHGGVINPGDRYRRYVYENDDGSFKTEKIHLSCLYDRGV